MLIQTTCTFCRRELRLSPRDLQILEGAGYHFDCPVCRMHCDKPGDEKTRVLLSSAGVTTIGTEQAREDELVEAFRAQINDERAFARFVYG